MNTADWIEIRQFCHIHEIAFSFIDQLHDIGLIEITTVEQHRVIPAEQITALERMVRLHHDLGINPEGIDAIFHLLDKVDRLREEVISLQNRLRLYEGL